LILFHQLFYAFRVIISKSNHNFFLLIKKLNKLSVFLGFFLLTLTIPLSLAIEDQPLTDSAAIAKLIKKHMKAVYVDTNQARLLIDSAVFLADSVQDYNMLIRALNTKSRMYLIQGDLVQVLPVLRKGLSLRSQLSSERLLSSTYTNFGQYYYQLADYEKGAEAHFQAVRIAEEFQDSMGLARGYNNLGNIFIKLGNYPQALAYYQQALQITRESQFTGGMAHVLGNLGIVYRRMQNPDSARAVIRQSLAIHKQLQLKNQEALNYSNLAAIFEETGRYDSAVYYYRKYYDISDSINNIGGKVSALLQLAHIEASQQDLGSGFNYLGQVLPMVEEYGSNEYFREYYRVLSDLHAMAGDYDEAFAARQEFEKWKDSTITDEHLKEIERLKIRYESEKKENEILLLSRQNFIQEQALERRNLVVQILIIGFAALVVITFLSFLLYMQRLKNKQQLALINTIATTQEEERKRIAAALHDSIGSSLAGLKIQMENIAVNFTTHKTRNLISVLDETASEVRRISHGLIPGVLLKLGLVESLSDLMRNVDVNSSVQATFESYGIDERLPADVEVKIYRMCQELVQNALKHGQPQNLSLQLTKHPQLVNIIVEDDGSGFVVQNKDADGFGLKNLKAQIEQVRGDMQIDSHPGRGTLVTLNIPV